MNLASEHLQNSGVKDEVQRRNNSSTDVPQFQRDTNPLVDEKTRNSNGFRITSVEAFMQGILRFIQNSLWMVTIVFNGVGVVSLLLYMLPIGKRLRKWNFSWCMESIQPEYNGLQVPFKANLFSSIEKQKPVGRCLRILEIGIGTGANLAFYPKNVQLMGIDPNRTFEKFLLHNLEKYEGIEWLGYVGNQGENIKAVQSESIDVVVTSSVFCSIEEFEKVIKEVKRVLVPGGKYYFCEHVLDNRNTWALKVQHILHRTHWWAFIACGCKFRDFETVINSAGFSEVKASYFYIDYFLPFLSPHYHGYAVNGQINSMNPL